MSFPSKLLTCAALLLGLLHPPAARAAPPGAAPDAVIATRLLPTESIPLDGTLAHPAWQRAPAWDRFVEKDPVNGAAPAQATTVRVLFDERALYFGITAHDTAPERIRDTVVRYDGVNRTQDFVVVYVDAIGRRTSAQFFRVNAAGSLADGLHTASDDSEDFAPDFDWDAATARLPDGRGWTAVLRLPFASLRFAPGVQDWRFMVARRLPRDQFHLMASVPIPRDAPSFIDTLQPLAGVELPQRHGFLTLRPSVTLRAAKDDAGRRSEGSDASLDLKWRPHASLLVDATLNPDFSQVELDVPQLAGNSRFALFYPEKRPFFFESADLLRAPIENALYTRSFTEPRFGLRGTWRGTHVAGTAFAIDDRGGGFVLVPGPYGTDFASQPASRAVVARVRHDDGRLAIGGLAVHRRYADHRGDNTVIGPDVGVQLAPQWRLRAQWLHSRTTALPGAGDSLERKPAVDGDRVFVRAMRNTGHGETTLTLDDIGTGFRHDSGFVNQAGTRKLGLFQSTGWSGLGPFNEFFVNVDAYDVRDRVTGEVVQQVVRPGLWGTAARNLEWWFEVFARSALRTASGAPLLRERYVNTGLVMTPASWFPLVDGYFEVGELADTSAGVVRPGARVSVLAKLRPLAPLELEPSWRQGVLRDGGSSAYREQALQLLAVWHFDARHHLRAIVQRQALDRRAEGIVAAQTARETTQSLTYAFRRSSGTRLFVGATQRRSREAAGEPQRRATEAFVKLQFDAEEFGLLPR